ncbi:hypothetical protein QPK87_38075 [Kamptonema cortianum]|nr:hypothetical protein [Kamptonema cortianum]MDL5049725.1 hypothetical protein [Oscillatoria amoena NRMC-F 0135]
MKIDFQNEKAPLVLMVALIVLIVVCVMVFLGYGEFKRALEPVMDPGQLKGGRVQDWDASKTEEVFAQLKNPAPWVRDERIGHQVFVPKQMKYNPQTRKAEWVDLENETVDGIPFWWLDKYGLSKVEGVGKQDPDKDGFTNYEEYEWFAITTKGKSESDPTSAESTPDWATKLVGKEYIKEDFYILFKEYNEIGGVRTFQINRTDKTGRVKTEFLKLGEKSEGVEGVYTLESFEKKVEKKLNPSTGGQEEVNISELKVKRDDGLEITLVMGDRKEASIISAIIDFPLAKKDEKSSFTLKEGEVFEIRGNQYKVIDIQPRRVTIKGQNAQNQQFEIDITDK